MLIQDSLLEIIRMHLGLKNLELDSSPDWGSRTSQGRQSLHAALGRKSQVLSSSISHTNDLGAFVCTTDSGVFLGLDLELTGRITDRVAQRVSTAAEFEQAPSAASLWVAKESSFKALRELNQPQTISEIQIGHWQSLNSQIETFQFAKSSPWAKHLNTGCVVHHLDHSLAFFAVRP